MDPILILFNNSTHSSAQYVYFHKKKISRKKLNNIRMKFNEIETKKNRPKKFSNFFFRFIVHKFVLFFFINLIFSSPSVVCAHNINSTFRFDQVTIFCPKYQCTTPFIVQFLCDANVHAQKCSIQIWDVKN